MDLDAKICVFYKLNKQIYSQLQLAKSLTYNNLQLTSPFVNYYFFKSWEYLGVNLFGGNAETL